MEILGRYRLRINGIGSIKKDEGMVFNKFNTYNFTTEDLEVIVKINKINTKGYVDLKLFFNQLSETELENVLMLHTIEHYKIPDIILDKLYFSENNLYNKILLNWINNNNFVTKIKKINSVTFENDFNIEFHFEKLL